MKKVIYISVILMMGFFASCQSYEKKMEKYRQKASEIKEEIVRDGGDILCENTDSVATKIFYKFKDMASIVVYDLSTDSVTGIEIEGLLQYGYKSRKYDDRLFVIAETGACNSGLVYQECDLGYQECVFYIDIRDNSTHSVICCEEAEFRDGEIYVKRAFAIDESVPSYKMEWMRDEYTLPTNLSDEEYALREKAQEEKEETMAREERSKTKEIEIYIRATHPVGGNTQLYETRGCTAHVVGFGGGYENEVVTDLIQVPYGKMWVSKSITRQSVRPQISYNDGRRGVWYEDIPNGTITIRGGQSFRLKIDPYPLNQNSVFRMVFTEVNDY